MKQVHKTSFLLQSNLYHQTLQLQVWYKLDGVPEKVRLPFEPAFVRAFLFSLLQLSFNHLNKHFLCFYLSNLIENIPTLRSSRIA